jgi:adhesin transport system membrane fusion protein
MLGTSPQNSIEDRLKSKNKVFSSFDYVTKFSGGAALAKTLLVLLGVFLVIMFLPWTQVVHGTGQVTGVKPQNRPQEVPSVISGQIQDWYVQEGDLVQKGDTIVQLTEVKNQYFDPQLLSRTQNRISFKQDERQNYQDKLTNLKSQIANLRQNRKLKIQQLRNKLIQNQQQIIADSMELKAAEVDVTIAQNQLNRIEGLKEDGLKSLSAVQDKQLKYQGAVAKLSAARSKLEQSRNKRENLQNRLEQVEYTFDNKISIKRSKINTVESKLNSLSSKVTKLENQLSNYQARTDFRHLRAPQGGRVTKVKRAGVGEMIKSGETVVRIMPDTFERAVELFISPNDYPLLYEGETALLQFDGWPSIVFSGWPIVSYGTFKGEIYAIDDFISKNGKFRILIRPAEGAPEWPDPVRAGSGATGMVMLSEVPVWYEIWRQLNGFPPNFYKPQGQGSKKS